MLGNLGNHCFVFVDGTSYVDVEALSADHSLTEDAIVPSIADG